jgi:hypothetical protein
LKQRILVILGAVVALLTLYTFVFRAPASGPAVSSNASGVGGQLRTAVAAQATRAGGGTSKAAPSPEAVPAPPAADSTAKTETAGLDEPPPPEVWSSDPFVRDWIMVNELANLTLKAITVGGDRSYVLINNQILEEGDEISGKRIVKIETDKVTLEQGGRSFTLLLGE